MAYGSESVVREAEAREQPYLTKLRLTKKVKGLIKKLFRADDSPKTISTPREAGSYLRAVPQSPSSAW